MDINIFTKMFRDKHFADYRKLKYKYAEYFEEFLKTLADLYYVELPLLDFNGENLVFVASNAVVKQSAVKLLLKEQSQHYGIKAAEDEIVATTSIESIDFSRESVRRILKGMAPKDEQEDRILGIKKGLEFISDTGNKLTEENLYKLYMMTVGDFLCPEDGLKEGNFYRHDTVFIVSDRLEHSGLDYKKVPEAMRKLIEFSNTNDDINDLVKASIIHFYVAYVHPYFDGNGRMARLMHLWFLIQRGYQSALFVPFSSYVEKSRKVYYDTYTLIEENRKYTNKIDVSPFIVYFSENVYNKINEKTLDLDVAGSYEEALKNGKVTEKETRLWKFVLSCYGTEEFSTKQLEKDFNDAAYATIRGFVLKFENIGLLEKAKYGTRCKYKIKGEK